MAKSKSNSKKKQQEAAPRNKQFLRVVLLFFLSAIGLNLLSLLFARTGYLSFLEIVTANAAAGIATVSGLSIRLDGNMMYLQNAVWLVNVECTALAIMIIFASFVMAYPASMRARGIAVAAGIPFIFGANVARLLIMAWIDKLKPEYSAYFHDYLWQVVFIMMVVFLWIVWIDKVVHREAKAAVS